MDGTGEVIAGSRPEQRDNFVSGIDITDDVDISEMLGSEKIVYFNINNSKCSAKVDAQKQFGQQITLKINPEDFLFFDAGTKERIG